MGENADGSLTISDHPGSCSLERKSLNIAPPAQRTTPPRYGQRGGHNNMNEEVTKPGIVNRFYTARFQYGACIHSAADPFNTQSCPSG